MRLRLRFFFLFAMAICMQGHAQIPALRDFTPLDYSGGTQNWDIDESTEHRMMFANNAGLLCFDGDVWGRFQVANYTSVRSILFDPETNLIYAGAFDEFGYFEGNTENFTLEYKSISQNYPPQKRDFGDIWKIAKVGTDIVYQAKKYLFVYNREGKLRTLPVGHVVDNAALVNGKLYLSCKDAILVYSGGKLSALAGTEALREKTIQGVLPYGHKLLFVTSEHGLFVYDGQTAAPFVLDITPLLIESRVFCAAISGSYLAFGTVKNGLIVKDMRTGLVSYANTDTGLRNSTVLSLRFDRYSNLWLGLDNGIAYVMLSSPYHGLLGTNNSIGTGYASAILGQQLYLGTNQGLFSLGYPLRNSMTPEHSQPVQGVSGQIWCLRKIYGKLLCGANDGAFVVEGNTTRKIDGLGGTWNFIELKDHPDYVLTCDYDGFAILKAEGGSFRLVNRLGGFSESSGNFLQDTDGSIWVSHWQKGIYHFRLSDDLQRAERLEHYNQTTGLPIDRDNLVCKIQGKVYVSSVDGFRLYSPHTKKLEPCEWLTKLFDTYGAPLHIVEQPDGALWAYKKDFFKRAQRKVDGSYEREDIAYSNVAKRLQIGLGHENFLDEKYAIMNYDDGFFLVDCGYHEKPFSADVLIRSVYSTNNGDTLIYAKHSGNEVEKVLVPHKLNSLRIEFVLPEYRDEDCVTYTYYLEGYDSHWSEPQTGTTKEYTRLSKGNYVFHVKAHNMLTGKDSETQLAIRIRPAWYETWLAYLIYILLAGGALWLLSKYVRRRAEREVERVRKEKEKELREQQLQFEIEEQRQEAELAKLRNEQLEVDLKHKSSELADSTMNLVRKNDMLQMIDASMEDLSESVRREEVKSRITKKISDIRKDIKMHMSDDANWEKFEENFNLVYDNFTQKLRVTFPDLKKNDLKLCAYLRMGLSSKEMASLLNTSVRSIETARYRLRKKLDIDTGSNLQDFIQTFDAEEGAS